MYNMGYIRLLGWQTTGPLHTMLYSWNDSFQSRLQPICIFLHLLVMVDVQISIHKMLCNYLQNSYQPHSEAKTIYFDPHKMRKLWKHYACLHCCTISNARAEHKLFSFLNICIKSLSMWKFSAAVVPRMTNAYIKGNHHFFFCWHTSDLTHIVHSHAMCCQNIFVFLNALLIKRRFQIWHTLKKLDGVLCNIRVLWG